jgi:8-amino-7-oxononanoate synthase
MSVSLYMQEKLLERRNQHAYRSLSHIPKGAIDFASNDYLGFSNNNEIANRAKEILENVEMSENGATGSRLISGNHALNQHVEKAIAAYHQSEDSLLFQSGYTANLGLLSCIAGRNDTIMYDELSHASIRDGIRLSFSRSFSFKHNDINDLSKKIQSSVGQVFIVTESIFSMDGNEAPLLKLSSLAKQHNAYLIVDEAHALGVKGFGLVPQLGIQSEVFARVVTFGKALGGHGAAVLLNKTTKAFLVNFSRPFIYTTGIPPSQAAYIWSAYQHLDTFSERINKLNELIQHFNKTSHDLAFLPSHSAIHCMLIPGNERVSEAERALLNSGFFVKAIKHPTVPKGQERLRICLHAFNTKKQVNELLNELRTWRARF